MMPQKKNPDMLELIRGRCGSLYGNLMAALTVMKAQPMTYNRDLQEDKKQLFDAADTVEACLKMAAAIVRNTAFNPDRIAAGLDAGYLDATALAEYLVRKGLPFRTAHAIVGRLVAECELQNLALPDVTLGAFKKACDKIEDDVYNHLGPENVVANYKTTGAAGHIQLTDQLNFWKSTLK